MASKKTGIIIGVAAAGVAAAALAGAGVRWSPHFGAGDSHFLPLTRISTGTIFSPPPGAPLSFADIFEKVSPAVVQINVTSHIDPRAAGRLGPGLPFNFGPPDNGGGDDDNNNGDDNNGNGGQGGNGQGGKGATPKGLKAQSAGSGFFISADGYITTNNHVVENAEDIEVTLKDGRKLPAKIIGRDEATDLAVIKVEGQGFPFVDFENSAKPRVGDWVLAVGNPFGLGGTATAGIVSAYGRDLGDSFVDFIQIDAPINRGNSGGPTFDIYGRVIGVNSAIFSPSGGSVGIGFAIPADVADQITTQLIKGGKISRGYLGATIQNVTPEIADSMGMPGQKGALVAELANGGPAQKAGIQQGDVIVELNGHAVGGNTELTRLVGQTKTGDTMHLKVLRGGKALNFDVKSGLRPSEAQLAQSQNGGSDNNGGPETPESKTPTVLGLTLSPLDEQTRSRLGLPAEVRGALVTAVKNNSDAAEKGLHSGDLIVHAGDRAISGPADVVAAAAQAKKEGRPSILVGVRREGRTLFLPLKIGEK
ncbi:Do family serine endopeptidase [Phenylobacterium montanum]|uniref:Do family serine endopeptidase n=1 Tax=Phenylobacterium montanum TaxID=2823693 RepID=A0A975FWF8_9CAUL|nr:Do family serine endopeptidase [Caulobacter sp. S6]QUD86112.1 Do family serine endopeptidase [Caulobacter sp. S6]